MMGKPKTDQLVRAKKAYRKAISKYIDQLMAMRNVAEEPKVQTLKNAMRDVVCISKNVKSLEGDLRAVYDAYTIELEEERDAQEMRTMPQPPL
jgi:hypothetical protein